MWSVLDYHIIVNDQLLLRVVCSPQSDTDYTVTIHVKDKT